MDLWPGRKAAPKTRMSSHWSRKGKEIRKADLVDTTQHNTQRIQNTKTDQKYGVQTSTDLHIVPEESAFPHDQQMSLRVGRAESFLTEGQEGFGAGQVEQCWDSVGHSIWLLVEKH